MPSMTALTLLQPSGGTIVFSPRRGPDTNGVVTLANSSGVPLGDKRLTVQRSRTSQGREKATFRFTIPVMQTVTEGGIEVNRVARTSYADLTFSFDGLSTAAERQAVRYMVASFLGASAVGESQQADELIDNLEALY